MFTNVFTEEAEEFQPTEVCCPAASLISAMKSATEIPHGAREGTPVGPPPFAASLEAPATAHAPPTIAAIPAECPRCSRGFLDITELLRQGLKCAFDCSKCTRQQMHLKLLFTPSHVAWMQIPMVDIFYSFEGSGICKVCTPHVRLGLCAAMPPNLVVCGNDNTFAEYVPVRRCHSNKSSSSITSSSKAAAQQQQQQQSQQQELVDMRRFAYELCLFCALLSFSL